MRAIHVTHFADSGNLAFTAAAAEPQLDPASADMLVKVLACALNPGDCRLMDGSVALVMKPRAFPYTPGIDLCGLVLAVGAKCDGFKVGDRVVAAQDAFVHGSFAELAIVSSKLAARAPPERVCSDLEAASLPVAGATAIQAIKDARVGPGSRVLVIGGSGGVGTLVLQLAKLNGAAFVAATTTNAALVQSLGADMAIDYRTANWWDVLHHSGDDERERLDAVIDCVGDAASWRRCDDGALKRRARYVAVVDAPDTQVRSVGDLLRFVGPVLWRSLNPFTRSYTLVSSFPKRRELEELMALAGAPESAQRLRAVLDTASPLSLSLADAERAVALQRSQRAKGKLVFRVSD
ncbi:hypothetical protein PybrP1_010684 [[Pythium] brassicae (nom. inval.)]|nr:hypothetical protein PybrP1_010684 [[Pythium] brassicae (nom. inval.)]